MPETITTAVEAWILKRPAWVALCYNNSNMHEVMTVAIMEKWSVERFLEYSVLLLARINGGLVNDILDYRLRNPEPIVVDGNKYIFKPPEEAFGEQQPDPPRPVRRKGIR